MNLAGSALVSAIAIHWNVTAPTARTIIAEAGLVACSDGWSRYEWQDIWRLEGEIHVPKRFWRDFKAPLLKSSALAALDPEERSDRTMRRYVERGVIPSIRLSSDVVRVRECVFNIAIHHV